MALYTIKNLSFTYPNQKKQTLQGIDLTIEEGEFLLVCGKSGCGKTTLLRHLKTVLTPVGTCEGEILYHGQPLSKANERTQAEKIGYVWQRPEHQMVTDKVWHELAFGLENLGFPQEVIRLRVAEMASYFGIEQWFYRRVDELSGGQKQILNLASVMAMQPEVLILDEPTSQLDPIAAEEFLTTIQKINQELGITIVLIEQRLDTVFPMADRVLVMDEGAVFALDEPRAVGKRLVGRDLFWALPAPVRVHEELDGGGACPITVREGRSWLLEREKKSAVTSLKTSGEKLCKEKKKEKPAISAREVWFRYEKNLPDVICGMSLEAGQGEIYCMLGGNGAGKSTALSLLNGVRRPYRGKIFLYGKEFSTYRKKDLYQGCLGTLPQDPQTLFVRDTVEEDLWEMFPGKHTPEQEELLQRVIADTQIGELLSKHPYDLSGGEQQRAALAKVLLLQPSILLLDEPTKGLDGFYKKKLGSILLELKRRGVTILLVSHDLEFCASYGDTCSLLFGGEVVTTQPAAKFFAGNNFYTTVANRMSRGIFEDAVTTEDVIALCRRNQN